MDTEEGEANFSAAELLDGVDGGGEWPDMVLHGSYSVRT